jgi:uncharacterized membrane protein YccF (DUF307 family)
MIGTSPGRSAGTACRHKYQLVTRSGGTAAPLWRDRERSETIPFDIAAFRIGIYALWPFGYTTIERRDAGAPSCIGNVLWLILAGWWLALAHIVTGIALCITIIDIPFGIANFKLIPVSLLPLGREIVPTSEPFAAR